jgi:hypothetical protein
MEFVLLLIEIPQVQQLLRAAQAAEPIWAAVQDACARIRVQ